MQFDYLSKSFEIEGASQNDHIYRCIYSTGTFYEIDLLEYMYKIKPYINSANCKNVVLDIGANIGNHSIFLSNFVADHLIAIEPNPDVLPRLRKNLAINADNYTVYECAVSDKKCKGTIIVPESMGDNIGAARVNEQNNDGNIDISTIDVIISSWISNEVTPVSVSLIKIDVEGMELKVLKGAENTIAKYKPHIFTEAATKEEFQRIYDYLRNFGYRRMPGKWAATPVYHFAYQPTFTLYAINQYMQLVRVKRKIRRRLT